MRCPKCKTGRVIEGECINCGWAGPTKDGSENPPERERERETRLRTETDREARYAEQAARRREYHSAWQKKHADKVKEWHKKSYMRHKKGKNDGDAKEDEP